MLFPVGRSVYNAMDVKLTGNVNRPIKGIRRANFQVSYTYSKFINSGGSNPTIPANSDQDFEPAEFRRLFRPALELPPWPCFALLERFADFDPGTVFGWRLERVDGRNLPFRFHG